MKKLLLTFFIAFLIVPLFGQQVQQTQNKAQLASSFFRDKQYEKAAPLFRELFEESNSANFFEYYINCLILMKDYENAIKVLKKQYRATKNTNLQIDLGYVYKEMGDLKSAEETFNDVINNLSGSKGVIITVGNNFFNRREFEYAEKTYLKGREILPGEMFHENLASVYAYLRDYTRMMNEYLALVKSDPDNVVNTESRINSLFRYDFDKSLQATVKKEVIKATQSDPDVIAYTRLLIWIYIIEKNYDQALLNAISLDKRTHQEENNILNFAREATSINQYDVAMKGLNYLITRKPVVLNLNEIKQELVYVDYNKFLNTPPAERIKASELESKFSATISELGYKAETAGFAQTYAHFLAFYMGKTEQANQVINSILAVRELNNLQRSKLRIEQADINVLDNNLWEATLQYAQIIDGNKENPLGDDVKLKRAKVSFYLGDISWARTQLDVLKASTSKLIANDAMDLSLLISTNYDLDSIEEPIQMYARAELLLFQNKDSLANITLDSISTKYPIHSLNDRILMKKAEINLRNFNFDTAVSFYETVVNTFSYSTSADDALFNLAVLYEEKYKNLEKAKELYQKMMTNYPGSVFVDEARKRFRTLRGDKLENEENSSQDGQLFNGF